MFPTFCAVRMTAGLDEVRCSGSIQSIGLDALTAPRSVPLTVLVDHHHLHFALTVWSEQI